MVRLAATWASLCVLAHAAPLRVILDTDIGDDIDDAWALSALLQDPRVDLRLVVTDSYSSLHRAQVLAKFLDLAGRLNDVPAIALGPNTTGKPLIMEGWASPKDLAKFPGTIHDSAADAIIEEVTQAVQDQAPISLLVLSPCPAVAHALQRAPWLSRVASIHAMGGSIWHGNNGTGLPVPEWNVRADVASSRVLYAHLNVTAPLDVAGLAQIDGPAFGKLLQCQGHVPVVRALLHMFKTWLPRCPWPPVLDGPKGPASSVRSSVVYDAVAVSTLQRAHRTCDPAGRH
ncbi:unnamed protein product [Symbiodinium natans]|uniref:Inosine/uridine-preferring nucleoside hydrolase domain-containing protein n=1 Tax=Symbiodinium natans TaxID=878477 RepID=A0A812RQR5_9DINO|nr:unnamed protein product [Symbiodinium natans]